MKSIELERTQVIEKFEELGSVRKTANFFGVHHRTMSKYLGIYGVKIDARPQVIWIDNNSIQCSICQSIKPLSEIAQNKNTQRGPYYQSFCIKCRSERNKARRLGKDQSFNEKASRVAQSARKSGVDFALTAESLKSKWEWQEGKCFYTDIPLSREMGKGRPTDDVWSIDRVVPEKGYVYTNIVICSNKANRIKSDMTSDEMKLWVPIWYGRLQAIKFGLFPVVQPADKMSDWWKNLNLEYQNEEK